MVILVWLTQKGDVIWLLLQIQRVIRLWAGICRWVLWGKCRWWKTKQGLGHEDGGAKPWRWYRCNQCLEKEKKRERRRSHQRVYTNKQSDWRKRAPSWDELRTGHIPTVDSTIASCGGCPYLLNWLAQRMIQPFYLALSFGWRIENINIVLYTLMGMNTNPCLLIWFDQTQNRKSTEAYVLYISYFPLLVNSTTVYSAYW